MVDKYHTERGYEGSAVKGDERGGSDEGGQRTFLARAEQIAALSRWRPVCMVVSALFSWLFPLRLDEGAA